jgi:hypothetical protein
LDNIGGLVGDEKQVEILHWLVEISESKTGCGRGGQQSEDHRNFLPDTISLDKGVLFNICAKEFGKGGKQSLITKFVSLTGTRENIIDYLNSNSGHLNKLTGDESWKIELLHKWIPRDKPFPVFVHNAALNTTMF